VRAGASCEKEIEPEDASVGRAAAVSEFAQRRVLLCGGRDYLGQVLDNCWAYNPRGNEWTDHSRLASGPREEAASALVKSPSSPEGDMWILGGLLDGGDRTAAVERLGQDAESWENVQQAQMPEPRFKNLLNFTLQGRVDVI